MFKQGDKVICIDNINFRQVLTINQSYIVTKTKTMYVDTIEIETCNKTMLFYKNRFKLDIKEQRKQKLNQLCSNKETK